ncbi:hypothetical protein GCM10026987_01220 [Belliella aquatica]|uniref:Uncharacterized protein n=1 Tax=Belliella aquatica TaxID=1323734 RepID=A0ABQ1MXF5_9BACT|nr:hypothetical protein GCM10010993_28760 [Belliella aquatica]
MNKANGRNGIRIEPFPFINLLIRGIIEATMNPERIANIMLIGDFFFSVKNPKLRKKVKVFLPFTLKKPFL